MIKLVLIGLVLLFLLALLILLGINTYRNWMQDDAEAAVRRGEQEARWRVESQPLVPDEPESDMNVWIVRTAMVDGFEQVYSRHPVGGIRYDDPEFLIKLEELKDQARRRCLSLNAELTA